MSEPVLCRTFDDAGDSICDRLAQFVVWGHLYEKKYKGPKCARHLPPGVYLPGGFGKPAIYEIPAPVVVTREQLLAARDKVVQEGRETYGQSAFAFAVVKELGIVVES